MGIVALIVVGVIAFNKWNTEAYIIGDVSYISSGAAKMENFDKNDGAYTADPSKLFITFLPDGCEFYDVNGKPITALDITVGSKVKMTSSTGLKTNAEGYTTVEIVKVEVLVAAPSPEEYLVRNQPTQPATVESSDETGETEGESSTEDTAENNG